MDEHGFRSFSDEEVAFLQAVAARVPAPDGDRLRRDMQIAQVRPDGDYLHIDLPGYERPEYRGHHNLPFEGWVRAVDGGETSVLVNVDQNERLLALEFIYWEGATAIPVDWSTLKIVPEPPLLNGDR